ncbi:MAG TPA: 2,3-bisphosphoglycerate-independent phosphoglycerate mutase [Candidatus Dormibacteraeota bacterium]|nr:2,3-bisphosphoglycerate-independent phosphoglycerate mutase [Candidatus Dormibacteraeota bacterium]
MKYKPVVLAILDGWGCSESTYGNAIAAAKLPHWDAFLKRYPWTTLQASGEWVGLPPGIMGNSEVGHMNLGCGRVVPQGVVVIDTDIASGDFANNPTLRACLEHVKSGGHTLHLLGLLSDGQVHSSIAHLFALIDAAVAADVSLAIDCFLDGRDTPPRSAALYIEQLEDHLARVGRTGAIASVCGRFYAMDRDHRHERTQRAYDLLAFGEAAQHAPTATAALTAAYARDESDEFVEPTIIGRARPINDGDACIYINFRPDRARALTSAFTTPREHADADTTGRRRAYHNLLFATMTQYDETFANPVLFGPRPHSETFGEIVARAGLRQLRLAETEKYAHVTYFFNGGNEEPFLNEERKLIASDRSVETYDLAPAMRAREITDAAVASIETGAHDVIIMNYANADMIGHTGKWEPTIAGLEVLDTCLDRLARAVLAAGGLLAITADHGNAEKKLDAAGNPLTSHTTNPVPFILIARDLTGGLDGGGKLGDVAPTLLHLMDVTVPKIMTGKNLFAAAALSGR